MANQCDECGFDWEIPLIEEIRVIGRFPDHVSRLAEGASDKLYERPAPETWSPNEYVWHLADSFRVFAEWLHMTRTLDHPIHTTFDADQMAELRSYADRPAETGIWALHHAIALFIQEAAIAEPERQVTYKGWREDVTAGEVIGFAAHEVVHHTLDLARALGKGTLN